MSQNPMRKLSSYSQYQDSKKTNNDINLPKFSHQNPENGKMESEAQTSFISDAGQGNNFIDFTNGHEDVRPYKIQRFTKERLKTLRAGDFLTRHFDIFETLADAPVSEEYENTYLVADLYKEAKYLSEESAEEKGITSSETHKDTLMDCVSTLVTSPTGRSLLMEVMQCNWRIGINDLGGPDFHLDVPARTIILDDHGLSESALSRSGHFRSVLCVSLVRALRDVWQEIRHGGFDEEYDAQSVLMLERVRAADADVVSILVGWELRSEGHSDLWRHIIGSEEGDIAMAFSNHVERNPRSLFDGKALAAAFKQWHLSEARVNACDHEALEYMDSVVRDYPVGNPFGKKRPTNIGIEILSCLPDKTAYLRGLGGEILSDPLYGGMNDGINQSHLMQIMYDIKVTYVEGVPFTDMDLARRIFPTGGAAEKAEEQGNFN